MDDRIGPYRLERQLGSGGMGVVHLARDPQGKRVAIKVMHAQWSAFPEYQERFRSEAEAARRVARFCTAAVLDCSFGEPSYLVTEYIEGNTLAETVLRDGVLRGGDLESVAVGTAVALGAIHRAGIIHRDLKPSNIILSPYGPKVIDFGIAQLDEVTGVTGTMVCGTPTIIAPERIAGERASAAADVFSWGCVVAYAGTGRWPFGMGTGDVVHYRVMNQEPDLTGLDERLRPLARAALAKNPAERPTVSQLLEQMTGLGLQLPEPVRPLQAPTQTFEAPASVPTAVPVRRAGWWSRGRIAAALAVGTAVMAGAAVTAFVLSSGTSEPRLLLQDDFKGRMFWPVGRFTTPTAGTADLGGGHYRLTVSNPGQGVLGGIAPAANVPTFRYSDVTVTAMASGTGAYGVWCQGNPPKTPVAKYEFYVTAAGETAIIKRGQDMRGTELSPFRSSFAPASSNHIQAQCKSAGDSVRLTLTVNGHKAATAVDRTQSLRPGAVGLVASARNVQQASVDYTSFSVETRK